MPEPFLLFEFRSGLNMIFTMAKRAVLAKQRAAVRSSPLMNWTVLFAQRRKENRMADRFVLAIEQIEKAMKDTLLTMNSGHTRFHDFVSDIAGEPMSDNDYLRILEIFYGLYLKKGESKAQMYCLMRMMQLEEARNRPYLRSMYPKIAFTKPDQRIESFVRRKRPFYQALSDKIERRWVVASTIFCLLLSALSVLAFRMNFLLSLALVLIVWWLLVRTGRRWLAPLLMQERIQTMIRKLDPVQQKLERAMAFRNPDFSLFDPGRITKRLTGSR